MSNCKFPKLPILKNLKGQIDLYDIDLLWKQLRSGDKAGLAGLYRHYSKMLFIHGLTINSNREFIQDCVQEVYIDLWKYHQSLPAVENIKLYFFKSLRNKIYKEHKKEFKWTIEESIESLESVEACYSSESNESFLINFQREDLLQRKLAYKLKELPIRQKEVIQYLFFENFSYEETSKLMGINLRSVYTLAWKAISSLKKSMS